MSNETMVEIRVFVDKGEGEVMVSHSCRPASQVDFKFLETEVKGTRVVITFS
jgi:hypothetical protein